MPAFDERVKERHDEDAAAVIAVLALISARDTTMTQASATLDLWAPPARLLPTTPTPGPRAWWGSGLPR